VRTDRAIAKTVTQLTDWKINQVKVSDMGVLQTARNHETPEFRTERLWPEPGCSSVVMATRFLDAALQIWDEDQARAKSQIKVAAAMLRIDTDEPPIQDKSIGRVVPGLVPWQARKVREFIDGSLNSKIRLQDCAGKARLSASHFSRAFKATFGTTLLDYIHRRRVERAQQLMLISEQPLAQIALSCGFGDQAHYCRVFRTMVGLSPNAWRRQNMVEAPDE
jgi:AraC family transcriptional regulator